MDRRDDFQATRHAALGGQIFLRLGLLSRLKPALSISGSLRQPTKFVTGNVKAIPQIAEKSFVYRDLVSNQVGF